MNRSPVPERLPPRGPQAALEPPRTPDAPERAPGQFDLFAPRARAPVAVAQPRIYTVGELTREVKGILEGRFPGLHVRGEVSNLRRPSSGHLYFTLKDADACIGAVLFAREARRLRFAVQSGLSVLVRGRMSLYEPQGQYQLICDSIEPLGAGALQVAFEQLKARLEAEGLFDPARKRRLPFLPVRIAVVTSPAGAAVHDFLRVLHRRFPNLPVLIVPARVQGDGAAQEIARGILRGAAAPGVDVLVVARGDGRRRAARAGQGRAGGRPRRPPRAAPALLSRSRREAAGAARRQACPHRRPAAAHRRAQAAGGQAAAAAGSG